MSRLCQILLFIVTFSLGFGVVYPIFDNKSYLVKAPSGKIVEQPTNLTINTWNHNGYNYVCNNTFYNFSMKQHSSWGDGFKFQIQRYSFIFQPSDYSYRNKYGSQDYLNSITDVTGIINNAVHNITYKNTFPNVDLQYEMQPDIVKEYFTIKTLPRNPATWLSGNITLDFGGYIKYGSTQVYVDGINKSGQSFTTSSQIDFMNGYGEILYSLPAPYATDKNGNSVSCQYEVKNQGQQIWFYVRTPYSWLKNATLPVKVDPTFSVGLGTSSGTQYGCQRKMCRSSNGVLYTTFYSSPRNRLAKSINNGSTWSPNFYIASNYTTGRRNQTEGSIAITGNDVIYCVWQSQVVDKSNLWVRFRRFWTTNNSFSKDIINVTSAGTATAMTSIVVDSNDNAYIAFRNSSSWDILLLVYFAANNSFHTNTFLIDGYGIGDVSLVIDSFGVVHEVWSGGVLATYGVRHRKFYTSNLTVNPIITNVSAQNGYNQRKPSVLVDKIGNVHVVWYGQTDATHTSEIRYKQWWVSNNTWNPIITNITKIPTWIQWNPNIGLSGTNDLYVLWGGKHNSSHTYYQIRSSNYTASTNTWSQPTNWTGGNLTAKSDPNMMYAFYPNISGVQTNIPIHGISSVYANGTGIKYLNSSRVDWGVPAAEPDEFSYKNQGFWNLSFKDTQKNENIGVWNLSFMNATNFRWKQQGYWNVSFMNETNFRWKEQSFWNVSFSNTMSQKEQRFWNVSFMNTTNFRWKEQSFWNVSFQDTMEHDDQEFWNISFMNISGLNDLPWWNVSFRNSTCEVVYVDDNAPVGWYNETHLHDIQQGVTTVSRFGTVYVWAGNYTNHTIINKTLSIIGNGSTSILRGLRHEYKYSITVNNVDFVNISHMNVTGANRSVYVNSADNCTVNNSFFYPNFTAAIYTSNSKYGDYSYNYIKSNTSGIYLGGDSSHTNVTYNTFNDIEDYCVLVRDDSQNCTVSNNSMNHAEIGIYTDVSYGSNDSFFGNTIKNGVLGILTSNSKYLFISNNTIWNMSSTGIGLLHTNYTRIINNTVSGNLTALLVPAACDNNTIYNNFFGSNIVAASDAGKDNVWNTTKTLETNIIGGSYLGGNYYYDNIGTHIGNGFSVPYVVGTSTDYLPLVYPHWDDSVVSYWNVSFSNEQVLIEQGFWNTSFMSTPGFDNIGFWNASFSNTANSKEFGFWNLSFQNSSVSSWTHFGFWNASFSNLIIWSEQGFWNTSFRSSSLSRDFGYLNVSFGNIQTWNYQGFWNISFCNSSGFIYITNEYPANHSGGIGTHPALFVTVNSSKGYDMNLTWMGSEDNGSSWFYLGHNFNVSNGTYSVGFFNATLAFHRYDWKVIVNDGHKEWNNESYYFTCGVGGGNSMMYEDGIYMLAVGMLIGFILGPEIFDEYEKRRKRKK